MKYSIDPSLYDAWYHTNKGKWIGNIEFTLLMKLLRPLARQSLLDVGCGTGYFSQRFSDIGLRVTGIDQDMAMLQVAKSKNTKVNYIQASAYRLPFDNMTFDYCSAITSLCFIHEPQAVLKEMWRVSRKGIILGLLNRSSLLHLLKRNSQGYKGARWDTPREIREWCKKITANPQISIHTAVWCPIDNSICRLVENILPDKFNYGGFIALYLMKEN